MRKIGACVLLAQLWCPTILTSILNVVIHRSEQNQSECREYITWVASNCMAFLPSPPMAVVFCGKLGVLLGLLFGLAQSARLYTEEDPVVILSSDSLKQTVLNSSSAWLLQFYSSWCGHCIQYSATWKALAGDVKGMCICMIIFLFILGNISLNVLRRSLKAPIFFQIIIWKEVL